jgi:hypothetical protein
VCIPRIAEAGRSQYGWLYGSEVMPERGAEVQTWVAEENGRADGALKETSMWWGALVGVTDQLELAFPVEFLWARVNSNPATFTVERFGIEARYRLVSQDPEEAPDFAPLVRLAVKRDVGIRDTIRAEADVVASYQSGPFHALVDLGAVGDISTGDNTNHFEFRPGAGVSIKVTNELRLGAEVYSELSLDTANKARSWAATGPNIAWTHGRFWLSAAYLIGVYQIDNAPRVVWGIAF